MSQTTQEQRVADEAPEPEPPTWRPPEPRPGRNFWLLMLFSLVAVGGVAYLQYARVDKARRGRGAATLLSELPVLGQAPDFTLIERSGRQVSLADLKGKVWVADFIFTECGGPCPIMTRRMRELHQLLEKERLTGVVTVSFSVDPETDTPKELSDYARMHKADAYDWLFLTCNDGATMREDISVRGFKLTALEREGSDQIEHSPRFVLVDQQGRIRGYYEIVPDAELERPRAEVIDKPMPAESRRKLLADIRGLLQEARR